MLSKLLKDILKFKPFSECFLDIGCGNGEFLKVIKKNKSIIGVGVEYSDSAIEQCHNIGLGCLKHTALKSIKDSTYDVITMLDVIEHLKYPREYLKEVYRLLKPGGLLIVRTMDTIKGQYRKAEENWSMFSSQHIWYFNHNNLKKLLKEYKFKFINCKPYDSTVAHFFLSMLQIPAYIFGERKSPRFGDIFDYWFIKEGK